ncbi:LptF/LptG family permease [Bacteroides acidifaciens]|uniref:YjgP/YjgQ family permease n=2 Tax=Bacteroides acidifaciens TaxID=85831 RepID=A0A7K3MFG0_9BACE|nr:LptF/LptG family permease [Bacteroides acidifaciens]MBF0731371.1 LptF/LptG family permease [Bacteroides acidifaciens]MBF0836198.1 LptF/LptG family permease [Bacteroides acidifaciens]NDO53181.1 YjgP/YjgQ family permease [Bacteroides acidifaciens]TFU45613.1 YjgP/YjgQ family permease [Bacteroides acidifaciens]
MLRIKKLDIFIVKSFLMLFIGTFFICLFIFMMQFLWRYVDELVGKGLEMSVMAQFFFYSALTLVPVSLPLAVLLASLITFGNFGERYELLAMKAAGISLLKIMRPLAFFVCGLVGVSFYFQNVVGPIAQAKLGTLILSMKQKSPELDIPEGVFYSEIKDYNLKVAKKDRKTGMLYDVLIYNMKDGFENAHIIYADSGRLEMTADKQHLWLHLYSGDLFENLKAQSMKSQNVPYRRESFREKHTLIEFDSDFNMADESIMSNQSSAKNMAMLQTSIDSMKVLGDSIGRQYYREVAEGNFRPSYGLSKEDTVKIESADIQEYNVDSLYAAASLTQKQKVISSAASRAENVSSDLSFKKYTMENNDYAIRKHKTEWHKKITISLSCLLFFFIGAPLGGIIRKGGLGMPVIVSVLVFIIYYIIDNTGYKMARDGKWVVWMGMWTSSAVLAPLGIFLTYKSNKDSVVLNADAYINWFKKIVGIRSVRHIFKKEVIIHDPDYARLADDLEQLSAECKAYAAKKRLEKAPNYFKLWMANEDDNEVMAINEKLEALVEEMSNTKSATLIGALNNYPVISVSAHVRPFHIYWLNLAAGVIFPIGLFFYFRIWTFRVRLAKDMERIIKNNEQIQFIIQKINK